MYIYYILELKIFFLGNHGGIERGTSVRISHRWHPVSREGKEVFSRCRKKKGEREGRGKEIYRQDAPCTFCFACISPSLGSGATEHSHEGDRQGTARHKLELSKWGLCILLG